MLNKSLTVIPLYRNAYDAFSYAETVGIAVLVGEERFELAFDSYSPGETAPYPQDVYLDFQSWEAATALADRLGLEAEQLFELLWPKEDGGLHYLFDEPTADALLAIDPIPMYVDVELSHPH